MHKRLTISLDEQVYEGLYSVVGRGNISRFIENLVRPHVVPTDVAEMAESYRQKAEEEARLDDAMRGDEDRDKWDVTKHDLSEAELEAGYRAMAADEEQEMEALEWVEGTLLDMNDESW